MVSRFPNGSPITGDGSAHVLAEFSRDVTKTDLVDKIDFIFYDGAEMYAMKSLANAQVESENILVVKDPDSNAKIELTIDGNKLITSEQYGQIFDIDFDNQHRKFFEQASATYLMQLPNIIEQVTPERYAVVRVTNTLETNGTLSVAILVSTNNEPWSGDAELSDIDVAAFFADNILLSTVSNLVKAILKMEYNIPSGVTFNVVTTVEQSVSVDGGLWNLFTDGSAFVPLVMTSRFPNGAPIMADDIHYPGVELCSFSRAPRNYELVGMPIVAVIEEEEYDYGNMVLTQHEGFMSFDGFEGKKMEAIIQGNVLKVSNGFDAVSVYDVDYNNQHQRLLTLPSSETPLMFECANPDVLGVGQGVKLDLMMFNNLGSPTILVVTNGDTMVKGSNGQVPPQDYTETANCLTIVNLICEMEFSNWDELTFDYEIYTDEPISGTVDLLTVSTITPA